MVCQFQSLGFSAHFYVTYRAVYYAIIRTGYSASRSNLFFFYCFRRSMICQLQSLGFSAHFYVTYRTVYYAFIRTGYSTSRSNLVFFYCFACFVFDAKLRVTVIAFVITVFIRMTGWEDIFRLGCSANRAGIRIHTLIRTGCRRGNLTLVIVFFASRQRFIANVAVVIVVVVCAIAYLLTAVTAGM